MIKTITLSKQSLKNHYHQSQLPLFSKCLKYCKEKPHNFYQSKKKKKRFENSIITEQSLGWI